MTNDESKYAVVACTEECDFAPLDEDDEMKLR